MDINFETRGPKPIDLEHVCMGDWFILDGDPRGAKTRVFCPILPNDDSGMRDCFNVQSGTVVKLSANQKVLLVKVRMSVEIVEAPEY